MLPPEFWTGGAAPAATTAPAPAADDKPAAEDKPAAGSDDIEAAALAEMAAAARADMAAAAADEKRVPEPPAPAEATVRRSTLPRIPEPPPANDATVVRGSLGGVPQAPPARPPTAEQTVFRSRPPLLPNPAPSPEVTVRRSTLPAAPSYFPNAAPPLMPGQPPAMAGPVALDPAALARRVTLRSGRASMLVDESGLTLRALLRKTAIAWSEIGGFEARYDDPANPMAGGHLVAVTRGGPVDLPATKRAMADLRYTQALLEAYRLRAQTASGY